MRRATNRGRVLLVVLLLAAAAGGCWRRCVPVDATHCRKLVDLSTLDQPCDPPDPILSREVAEEFRRRAIERQPRGGRPYQCLALSGGGVYGAFGIGVLNGWTESGQRPEFDVVTGISTGGIIATFAFLGPEHDAFLANIILEEADRRDLMHRLPLVVVPFADSLYTSRPMARQIRRAITPQILQEVAAAHAAGRRVYVGTTNLDTRRLVVWDMGAIASQGTPEALELYCDILLASSAVPMALPAIRIPVEIDGKRYEELHVDGGVSDEVFFRSSMIADQNRIAGRPGPWAPPGSTLYVIDNGKLYADPDCVKPKVLNILTATASAVLYSKTRDELHLMYTDCMVTGMEYRLTAVPQSLSVSQDSLRVTKADRKNLFEAGRNAGRDAGVGPLWFDMPPPNDPADEDRPRGGTRFATTPR